MISLIKNAILTATSFLSSKNAPPNTSPKHIERLKSKNHMESKKFYIVLTSVIILAFYYFLSVGILFFVPKDPGIVTGYVTIFSKTIEILAIIIASYVGAQAAVDLKYGSSSDVSLQSQSIVETIKEEVTVIHTNAKEEDYELR